MQEVARPQRCYFLGACYLRGAALSGKDQVEQSPQACDAVFCHEVSCARMSLQPCI